MSEIYNIMVTEFQKIKNDEFSEIEEQIANLEPKQKIEYNNLVSYVIQDGFNCKTIIGQASPTDDDIQKIKVVAYKIATGAFKEEKPKQHSDLKLLNSIETIVF